MRIISKENRSAVVSLGKMIFSRVQGESLGLDAPWAHPEPLLIFL